MLKTTREILMLRNKYIEDEIWRLKNKDRPVIKDKAIPPNLMDGPIHQRNLLDEKIIRLASESAAEEAELDLISILKEFQEWKKDNKGGFKDFLKSNKKPKIIKLKNGGTVNENSYAQLIDDYLDNIQVIEIDGVKESLTNYIKRMGGVKED